MDPAEINERPRVGYSDREGTILRAGDWITTPGGRHLEVIGPTPGQMLHLKANDGQPFPEQLLSWFKVRECLRNPILSP